MTAIPLTVRSAADRVLLSRNHLRATLPGPVPATTAEAVTQYGARSAELQSWFALNAVEAFAREWQAFVAAQMPAQGERPSTMGQNET